MGLRGGFMDSHIEVGEKARLPDGTSAEVTEIEADTVRGTRRLSGGQTVRFYTERMSWLFLRQGIIPRKHAERNYCYDDLRDRQWNPHSGKCESCGRWIPPGNFGHVEQ